MGDHLRTGPRSRAHRVFRRKTEEKSVEGGGWRGVGDTHLADGKAAIPFIREVPDQGNTVFQALQTGFRRHGRSERQVIRSVAEAHADDFRRGIGAAAAAGVDNDEVKTVCL